MSAKSTYDMTAFNKKLGTLMDSAEAAAHAAVSKASKQYKPVEMSFDETEAIPFASASEGSLVISVKNSNPASLDAMMQQITSEVSSNLKATFESSMKGAM